MDGLGRLLCKAISTSDGKSHGLAGRCGMTLNEAAEAWGKAHCSPDPLTPQAVLNLLSEAVLESGATMPRSTDRAVAFLAATVNTLRGKVRAWTAFLKEEHPNNWQIAVAIMVLTEILPKTRELYVTDLAMARQSLDRSGFSAQLQADLDQDIPGDPVAEAEANLAVFDALAMAALAAKERGLPHLSSPLFMMTDRTEEWKHYAKDLERSFRFALPVQGKAAAYRFIVAVTPTITGELPTFQAVQSHLKKGRRTVNRGKRPC